MLTIYEKARITGLDERQIELAQKKFDHNQVTTVNIHEAHDRVLIHAAWYDAGGQSVAIPHLGIGITVHGDSATLWRSTAHHVPPERLRKWTLNEDAMRRSGKYERTP